MSAISKEAILAALQKLDTPITASELAKHFGVPKSDVNSILYQMENQGVTKSNTTPPYWSLIPLEDQIARCLSADDPMTAREIAEQIHVPKTTVNSILYRLEGNLCFHDDGKRPNWYLIENDN